MKRTLFRILALLIILVAAALFFVFSNGSNQNTGGNRQPSSAQTGAESAGTAQSGNAEAEDGPNFLEMMREKSVVLSDEEKLAIVARARSNAEAAARSVGQDEKTIKMAGEQAEAAARQSLQLP